MAVTPLWGHQLLYPRLGSDANPLCRETNYRMDFALWPVKVLKDKSEIVETVGLLGDC